MPDFDKLEQEAQQAAQGHSEQVDQAISKGEQDVDQRMGQEHASQVQEAGTEVEKELGTQQGQQPPNQQ
jgi:MT0933-like antitoxin protein